jgi:hypothetical protein
MNLMNRHKAVENPSFIYFCRYRLTAREEKICYGANPRTSKFTNKTPTCSRLELFLKVEENVCFFQNALRYSWRCKFLQRWRSKSQ